MARSQLWLMLEKVLGRMPDISLADEVERLSSIQVAGIKHMPVKITPSKTAAA